MVNSKDIEYYLKNISRRWKKEVQNATEKVLLLFPYITPKTAEIVLGDLENINCEIYTVFSVKNFVSGASSLKTLKKFSQRGCQIYHLPRLHAKMVVISGQLASIGSQNLTNNGVRNKEASIITTNPKEVAKIQKQLENWLTERQLISQAAITRVEFKLPGLRKKYLALQREFQELSKEAQRLEENDLQIEKILANDKIKQKESIESLQYEISKIKSNCNIPSQDEPVELSLVQYFIWQSAIGRNRNKSVSRRPKSATSDHNFDLYENNWIFWPGQSSANKFAVGKAIIKCERVILEHLSFLKDNQKPIDKSLLINQLRDEIRSCVLSNSNIFFSAFEAANDTEDYMFFSGWFGINITVFINCLFEKIGLNNQNIALLNKSAIEIEKYSRIKIESALPKGKTVSCITREKKYKEWQGVFERCLWKLSLGLEPTNNLIEKQIDDIQNKYYDYQKSFDLPYLSDKSLETQSKEVKKISLKLFNDTKYKLIEFLAASAINNHFEDFIDSNINEDDFVLLFVLSLFYINWLD